jgi:diguanylate cyclase (GGDEF)-like protein
LSSGPKGMSTMDRTFRRLTVWAPEPLRRMFWPYVCAYRWLRERMEPWHVVLVLLATMGFAALNGGVSPGGVELLLVGAILLLVVGNERWEDERSADPLTGCANRRGMRRWLSRCRYPLAVLYADLDSLHALNAAAGHAEGDRKLVDAAWAMRASVRRSDLVVRLGSAADEFLVLAEVGDIEDASLIHGRIAVECEARGVRVSLGYALCHRPEEFEVALGDAEEDMRRDKRFRRCEALVR